MKVLIDIRIGESVAIDNGRVLVTLEEKSGQRARLSFEAAKDVPIERMKPQSNVRAAGLGKK